MPLELELVRAGAGAAAVAAVQVPLMLAPSVLLVLMASEDARMLLKASTKEHRGWRKVQGGEVKLPRMQCSGRRPREKLGAPLDQRSWLRG